VVRLPECEIREVAEVVDDRPFEQLVFRHLTPPHYGSISSFRLVADAIGTKVTASFEYDVPDEPKKARRAERLYAEAVAKPLHRAKWLLESGWPD
jgi:hypothetical protein